MDNKRKYLLGRFFRLGKNQIKTTRDLVNCSNLHLIIESLHNWKSVHICFALHSLRTMQYTPFSVLATYYPAFISCKVRAIVSANQYTVSTLSWKLS